MKSTKHWLIPFCNRLDFEPPLAVGPNLLNGGVGSRWLNRFGKGREIRLSNRASVHASE